MGLQCFCPLTWWGLSLFNKCLAIALDTFCNDWLNFAILHFDGDRHQVSMSVQDDGIEMFFDYII